MSEYLKIMINLYNYWLKKKSIKTIHRHRYDEYIQPSSVLYGWYYYNLQYL